MHIEQKVLPAFADMNTAHWPSDQQIQFSKAIDGIMGAEWFSAIPGGQLEKEQVATAFAFAALSGLRRRLHLAPDEELMRDNAGRCPPKGEREA